MKKILSKAKITYILLQMIALTFICLMSFIDLFINEDLEVLRFSIFTVTITVFILYEVIIHLFMYKIKSKNTSDDEVVEKIEAIEVKPYNEQYLWFEVLFFLDVIFIVSIISTFVEKVSIPIIIIIAFIVFYVISLLLRPLFGIEHHKE